ncbi:MAG: SRPBCC family protein [Myxococcales bacterium]|nr:SRPBCC family protein [Myxococcales bacterium]
MRRILTMGLAGLVVLLGLAVAGTFLLPREVRVERTVTVERPACTVFAVINGFKRFNEWSPWASIDPNTEYAYAGAAMGTGSSMSWTSDHPQVGNGSQEVVESTPCEQLRTALRFEGQPDSVAGWELQPTEGGTQVTWWLQADMGNNPIGRVMGTQMDGMIGPQYEEGLSNLKALVEKLPDTDFAGLEVETVDVEGVSVAKTVMVSAKDPLAVGTALGRGSATLDAAIAARGMTAVGAMRQQYKSEGESWVITLTQPVSGEPTGPAVVPQVTFEDAYAGTALKAIAKASPDSPEAFAKVAAWAAATATTLDGAHWTEQISDPATTAEADRTIALFVPVSATE